MSRSRRAALAAGVALIISAFALACSSPPPRPPAARALQQPSARNELAGAPEWIRRGCEAYWADAPGRGVCGVGSASGSRNVALMTSSAEGRGRTEIARTLSARVRSMLKDYQATTTGGEEFGTAASDEQHVVDVGKQLTDGTVVGAERRDLWVSPSGVVHALMVLDLERFQQTVWSMSQLSRQLRSAVAQRATSSFDGGERRPVAAGPSDGPLVLVTQAELDAMPRDTPVAWGKRSEDPDGPVIQIDSPKNEGVYEGPFPIKVAFQAGRLGHPVDMETLKLEYKVAWGIDITDRVREYVTGTSIDVADSELPEGKHSVEIQIEDVAGHQSTRLFSITVK